jgi:hypothetical protein
MELSPAQQEELNKLFKIAFEKKLREGENITIKQADMFMANYLDFRATLRTSANNGHSRKNGASRRR